MTPLQYIGDNYDHEKAPFYFVDALFRTKPELTLPECKRVAQVACYFAVPLVALLSPTRKFEPPQPNIQ